MYIWNLEQIVEINFTSRKHAICNRKMQYKIKKAQIFPPLRGGVLLFKNFPPLRGGVLLFPKKIPPLRGGVLLFPGFSEKLAPGICNGVFLNVISPVVVCIFCEGERPSDFLPTQEWANPLPAVKRRIDHSKR